MNFWVAVVTLNSKQDRAENIARALDLTEKALKAGAKWVALPEMMSFHGPYESLLENAEDEKGSGLARFAQLSEVHGATVFCGSVPEKNPNGKVFNTQFVYKNGELVAKYRKIHLFNLFSLSGEKLYCESDGFGQGNELVSIEHDGFHVALSTCYDLRFQELFLEISRKKPIDILLAPSAFTEETGKSHWELLTRSRAIDNLCYVVAPNQSGEHRPGKRSFGHSVVIDPWGTKLCDTGPDVGFALAQIDSEQLKRVRSRLPVLNNRRIYNGAVQ